jgi:heptaprenyl diphosphate synthase
MIRVLLVGFTFGNMAMMLYSFAGALLSFLVMLLVKRLGKLSVIGVSVLGGVSHNIGQILVAIVVLETKSLIYYLPVLLLAGIISGIAIGVLGGMVTKRISRAI